MAENTSSGSSGSKAAAEEKTSPEPTQLTPQQAIREAPLRFGVEPFVVAGVLEGNVRGETITVDRVQKLLDAEAKRTVSMEEEDDE